MNVQVKWQIDAAQSAVHLSVQRDLVLTPTNCSLTFESLELMYCQMLNAKIKAKQEQVQRLVKPQ